MPINVRTSVGAATTLSCVTISFNYDGPVFAEVENTPSSKYVHAFIDQWRAAILNPASGTAMSGRVFACNWAATDGCVNISCLCTGNPTSVRAVAAMMLRTLRPLTKRNTPVDATDPGLMGSLKDLAILVTGRNIFKAKTIALQQEKRRKLQTKLASLTLPKWLTAPRKGSEAGSIDVAPLSSLNAVKIPGGMVGFWIYMFVIQRDGSTEVSQEWLVRDGKAKLGYSRDALHKRGQTFFKKLGKQGLEFRAASLGRLSAFSSYWTSHKTDAEMLLKAARAVDSKMGIERLA